MTYQNKITVSTTTHGHMHNITDAIADIVHCSGILTGIVHIFNVGSTAVVGTIEYEPGLEFDFPDMMDRLIPPGRHYGHEKAWHDGNAHSHLQASLMGPSLTVPVAEGKPVLGTWQQIFHLECDVKPRERKIIVTVCGEPSHS